MKKSIIYNGVYAIYDEKAGSFSAPFNAPNDETARRIYSQMIAPLAKFGSDMRLYRLATMEITADPDGDVMALEEKPVLVNVEETEK